MPSYTTQNCVAHSGVDYNTPGAGTVTSNTKTILVIWFCL